MVVPAIFAIFGAICGVYLSVAGFMVTAIVVAVLVAVVSGIVGGPFSAGLIVAGFVAMQVGYAGSLATRVLGPHIWRMKAGLAAAGRDRALHGKRPADRHSH